MRVKSVLVGGVAVALVAAGTIVAHAAETGGPTPYIIGGRTVSSAPWAAELPGCSGTIVAPRWVLSANHCSPDPGDTVRIGNVNRGQGTVAKIKAAFPRFDISLILLEQPVVTTYAQIAPTEPPVGADIDIYGWGGTSENGGGLSPVLKTAKMRVSAIEGAAGSERMIELKQIGDGFAWFGDSGGPAFWNGQQIGTLCCGSTSGNGGGTESYSSLPNVRAWIDKTMKDNDPTTPPPASTNLALNRPTKTTAACSPNETGAKAVNGSVGGGSSDKWCSGAGATKTIEVDLGTSKAVKQVVVKHAGAGGESASLNTKAFTVQTSTGGGVWQTAATVTGNSASTTTHTFAANARWVRLAITDPVARIYEFEVY
jgi:hypothetical protein